MSMALARKLYGFLHPLQGRNSRYMVSESEDTVRMRCIDAMTSYAYMGSAGAFLLVFSTQENLTHPSFLKNCLSHYQLGFFSLLFL